MWNQNNNNYSNSIIWLVLLILIFFKQNSYDSISQGDYFKLTLPTNMTNSFFNS